MTSAPSTGARKKTWNFFVGLFTFLLVTYGVLAGAIKGPWEWLVPAMFPGAVEQGLIAPTLSWGTTLILGVVIMGCAAILKSVRLFAGSEEWAIRALDTKLDAIALHLGIDPKAVMSAAMTSMIKSGKKYEAIELYRSNTGASLADATKHVESLERAAT